MKIAITAQGPTADSMVDERFGRSFWISFYDEETGEWEHFDNSKSRNAMQGAGIEAAQVVADKTASIVITGVTGPKAYRALKAAKIIPFYGAKGTVQEALNAYKNGELTEGTMEAAVGQP